VTGKQGKAFMVLAVILGVAAGGVGYYSLTALTARAAATTGATLRDVVVTAADLTYGVKLERTMVSLARYPKDAIPAGGFSSIDSVVGQTTKVFMSAREPITATKLSSRGGGLSMLVRPNMRAASVEVNQVSGVSGFVLPGDRVDVLITVDPLHNSENALTRTLLQNIEVLAAGQKTQQADNKPITVQAVTLLVNPPGAEVLAHAQHEGEIHLVLRNPEDQAEVPVASFSTRQMLGISESPAAKPRRVSPPPAPAPAPLPPAPAPPAPAEPRKVRIIRSADVVETPAVQDSSAH
jgi:pilus assembly protein CpaB